jgi:sortase A
LQTDEDDAIYQTQLNPTNNGIMGFVEIDAIRVKLPIYHGTDESVLQVGVGHIEGTSLPVGGKGTHSAISGHRGLPSAMLFTDLDKLKVGTRFESIRWIKCLPIGSIRYWLSNRAT